MLNIHSEPPKPELKAGGPVLLALGFRPFFLLAACAAPLLIAWWLGAWSGRAPANGYYGAITWHGHEMLFGYAAAVIAGFLLTAVRNWTGLDTPSDAPLARLALLWLAGRLAPWLFGVVPDWMIAVTDLAFLPAVAFAIEGPLWAGQQKANRIFVPVLLLMFGCNLLVHMQALGVATTATAGQDMMLGMVILLIALLGGRVMPFFAQSALPGFKPRRSERLEIAAVGLLAAWILAQGFVPHSLPAAMLAVGAAVTQGMRVAGWYDRRIWSMPILWVLYSGLGWLVIGLLLFAAADMGWVGVTLARHALTLGTVGVITYGMMARVALGHTGRPIQPPQPIVLGFVLLNLAAALRVFGPLAAPTVYPHWIHLSGALWIFSFALFVYYYLPVLTKPRIDGKPG